VKYELNIFVLLVAHCAGHAIEAGWFLLQYNAKYTPRDSPTFAALQSTAINMIDWSIEAGWDKEWR